MVWKKVNNSDSGTSTKFGGNDVDKISDLFSNVDVDDVAINSDWKFNQTTGVDIKAVTEPSSPSSGYVRLFIDSGDGRIKIKKSNGDVVTIE